MMDGLPRKEVEVNTIQFQHANGRRLRRALGADERGSEVALPAAKADQRKTK